jgi:hypothetical protein
MNPEYWPLREGRARLLGLAVLCASLLTFAGSAHAATSVQNGGLEADSNGDSTPDCWQKGGYGTNTYKFVRTTDAHSGTAAEQVQISTMGSGDRKLITQQDSGACAPAVSPGASYTLSGWYKSNVKTQFVIYLRSSSGSWSYWTSSPRLAPQSSWTNATWTTPAVPSGSTHISFGFNLTQAGQLTSDDLGMSPVGTPTPTPTPSPTPAPSPTPTPSPTPDTTPPDTTITAHPTDPTTATNASFSFTSTETGSSYTCSLDGAAASSCASPKAYSGLATGTHKVTVAATDAAGNTDATPASFTWTVQAPSQSTCAPQTSWTAPQVQQATNQYLYTPMSDAAAAACVTPKPETVAANAQANAYVPSDSELLAFQTAKTDAGTSPEQFEWYPRYVTGRPGIANPTTDELIQWAAHKWGIPEDWLRAEYVQESDWRQSMQGDLRTESASWFSQFPAFSCPSSTQCNESLGITQVKWHPDGSEGAGTDPLRYKSTAFNIDYQASIVRFEYDNPYGKRSSWGDSTYKPLDGWLSIGAWFSCYPYNNSGQSSYISSVQSHLAARDWPQ